jgi:hypothetical protein
VGPELSPKSIFSKNITLADNLTASLHGKNFSKVLYAIASHRKYTRALTFQNSFLASAEDYEAFRRKSAALKVQVLENRSNFT